jgi:hypothetical protein
MAQYVGRGEWRCVDIGVLHTEEIFRGYSTSSAGSTPSAWASLRIVRRCASPLPASRLSTVVGPTPARVASSR